LGREYFDTGSGSYATGILVYLLKMEKGAKDLFFQKNSKIKFSKGHTVLRLMQIRIGRP
jgi:hypothetical protein